MYNIKDIITRMKHIANIQSNADLARDFNVSYNTFNTWLKRDKFPQEIILDFANRYNVSLDFLIFGKRKNSQNSNENLSSTKNIEISKEFIFYGRYEPLNISPKNKLNLDANILHSSGYYLIKQREIYYIAQVFFNPFEQTVTLKTSQFAYTLKEEEFYNINIGLIIDISTSN